jgi:hypothetical protein
MSLKILLAILFLDLASSEGQSSAGQNKSGATLVGPRRFFLFPGLAIGMF